MENDPDKREKFLKIYPNIPEDLRGDILVVVDDKTYTLTSPPNP